MRKVFGLLMVVTVVINNCTCENNKLIKSSMSGDIKQVKEALKNGADVNAKDKDGKSILDYANDLNNWYILELVKKYGAK